MKKSSKSRSSLFLMELIVAILFFSLVSAVCLKLFTKSHTMGVQTSELNLAVSQAGNAAELLKSRDGSMALLAAEYENATQEEHSLQIYYDKDFSPCTESEAAYCMSVRAKSEEHAPGSTDYYEIELTRTESGDSIYHLPLTVHRAYAPD